MSILTMDPVCNLRFNVSGGVKSPQLLYVQDGSGDRPVLLQTTSRRANLSTSLKSEQLPIPLTVKEEVVIRIMLDVGSVGTLVCIFVGKKVGIGVGDAVVGTGVGLKVGAAVGGEISTYSVGTICDSDTSKASLVMITAPSSFATIFKVSAKLPL